MTRVLLPGSYDPVTRGHIEIVRRALAHFDEVHVVVFVNPAKKTLLTPEERLTLLRAAFDSEVRVRTDCDLGLVSDYAARHGISLLLKGVRNEEDYLYERPMADHHLRYGIDTLLLPADPAFKDTSSHEVRARIREGRPLSDLLTPEVEEALGRILCSKEV